MLKLSDNVRCRAIVLKALRKCFATQTNAVIQEEYTNEPQYPTIQDTTLKARRQRDAEYWHETIRDVRTVEEKLIKINMPRYYGHRVLHLSDDKLPYNVLPAMQHFTRTLFELVESDEKINVEGKPVENTPIKAYVEALKDEVLDSIEFAYHIFSQQTQDCKLTAKEKDYKLGQNIVEQLHRVLINGLAAENAHLHEVDVDYNPRHESFWSVGGIDPPKNVIKSKKGRAWQKADAKESVDRWIQYVGKPYLALRHKQQIPTWKSAQEYENLELAQKVPRYNLDPRTLGYAKGNVHGTNIPGYWPGNAAGFAFISYQPRHFMTIRPASYGDDDFQEVLHAQAIQTSYAWLLALANYQGFNTFNELTYPLNAQTIITNGCKWSFYEYQLNTLLLHSKQIVENPKINVCRGTRELQLFERINEQGKCVGFNEEVLQHLVKFYINAPTVQRDKAELTPYLDAECKHIADYENVEQREFLEKTFKHISSNRQRHLEIPEIYLWEKIYKIDNKTRALEPRRRFFELDINPWRRTLDQHQKEYIPRCKRENGPNDKKNKWKKTYYP